MSLHSIALETNIFGDNSTIIETSASEWIDNSSHLHLRAGVSFLDTLIDCPVADYHLVSFAEWIRLPWVIITLAKAMLKPLPDTQSTPSSCGTSEGNQSRVKLHLYLETLCYRMQALTTFRPIDQPCVDFWKALGMILEKVREWYVRRMRTQLDSAVTNTTNPSSTTSTGGDLNIFHWPTAHHYLGDEPQSPSLAWPEATNDFMDAEKENSSSGAMDFDFDPFMYLDFWGGSSSYDHTIEKLDDTGFI